MTVPPRSPTEALAHTLVGAERSNDPGLSPGEAVERVLRVLAVRISPLLGTGGFQMLLLRALKRARGAHPCLGPVDARWDADPHLVGMEDVGLDVPPEERAAAVEAVVTELFGLLARFIGADLTIRLIRQSFPEANLESRETDSEESGDA